MDPPYIVSSDTALSKIRVMCSYGGQIIPRPHDKTLTYSGGETRIVAIDRRGASLSFLRTHLSSSTPFKSPFALKYQLPGHDLDSLVSVENDEDFENMLDEYDRVTNSPNPSRLRIFVFPSSSDSILNDSDSEKWFLDALRVSKLGAKEGFFESGVGDGGSILDSEVRTDGPGSGGGSGSGLGQESIVLETSSSFGSSSSSVSMSNLPPIRVHAEDIMVGLDKQLKLQGPESNESDRGVANIAFQTQDTPESKTVTPTVHYQENLENPSSLESQTTNPLKILGTNESNIIQVTGYPVTSQLDQHQQEVQYVTASPHYVTQYLPGTMPASPYYTVYPPQLQQQYHYQPNQSHPIYLLPFGQAPAYSLPPTHGNLAAPQFPVPTNLVGVPSVASTQVPMNPPPVPPASLLGMADGNLQSHLDVEKHKQFIVSGHIQNPPQPVSAVHVAAANYDGEFSEDPALVQIYKSQPQMPGLPVQGLAVGKDEMLSEGLPTDTIKQPISSLPMQ